MMKILLPALLALSLGCTTTEPSASAQQPKPEPIKQTAPTQPVATVQEGNPSRFHQLKDLQRSKVKVKGKEIPVWVMDDDAKRQEGMMFLTESEVKDEEGMIFVFRDEAPRAFWMSNTVLALDILYIDAKGKVVSIAQGKPFSEESLPSKGPAKYVLELKQGMAKRLGITPGTRIEIPKEITAKE